MTSDGVDIHPTAVVSGDASIGGGTKIGPYSIIGSGVVIGRSNVIGPHVVIEGRTTIGDRNTIFQFASIGSQPQDLKFKGEPSTLTVGDENLIREYVTIQPGTSGGGMKTVVGSRNLFMVSSHVGHDAILGDGNVLANCVALAGHVTVANGVIIGGLSAIHQFVRLGDLSFIGGASAVVKDVPPFCLAQGNFARLSGLNVVGLERAGHSPGVVAILKKVYRELFRKGAVLKDRVLEARALAEGESLASKIIDFCESSPRGVTSARGQQDADED